jgi:hypothetical protein
MQCRTRFDERIPAIAGGSRHGNQRQHVTDVGKRRVLDEGRIEAVCGGNNNIAAVRQHAQHEADAGLSWISQHPGFVGADRHHLADL